MELIQEYVDAGRSPDEYSAALAERAHAACRGVHGKQRTLQGFGDELRRLMAEGPPSEAEGAPAIGVGSGTNAGRTAGAVGRR